MPNKKWTHTWAIVEALDRRSFERKALAAWQKAVIAELGGEKAISAIHGELVEQATRIKLELDRQDRRAFQTKCRKAFHDTRTTLRRQLSGLLKALNIADAALGRTPRPRQVVPSLEDIAQRYAGKNRPRKGPRKA